MGRRGDNLDRFIIRIKETLESFRLVSQTLGTLLLFTEQAASPALAISRDHAGAYNTATAPVEAPRALRWSKLKSLFPD